MKLYGLVAIFLLLSGSLLGQVAPAPTAVQPPVPSPAQTPVQNRPTPSNEATTSRVQSSRQFDLEVQQMRATLEAMKANDAKIKDPAMKKRMELEDELWGLMFSRMSEIKSALLQVERQRASTLSPAAQMYRRQMLQGRTAGAPAATPTAGNAPTQTPSVDHP